MPVGYMGGKESDGKAVDVDLSYSVDEGQLVLVQGWLGVTGRSGDSGDTRALSIDLIEYRIELPSALSCSKGNFIYVDTTDTTGHYLDSTSYYTASGSNRILVGRLTTNKDDQNNAGIIFMGGLYRSS